MKIAVQNNELGQRGGISTYSTRLVENLNKIKGIEAKQFVNKIRNSPDIINIQYEPGMIQPQQLQGLIQKYPQPIIVTAHHMGVLPQLYPLIDGIIIHSKAQIEGLEEPWSYDVIPHPALVYEEKDKKEMRKKYGLPLDKKIVGTAGFIAGTAKNLPDMIKNILQDLKSDEFLYSITSYWKGGDFGFEEQIHKIVKDLGKEDQFRIDTDFVPEEVLNEKMQACDLLFAWNAMDIPGSNSGIGMDMVGTRRKVIVKDSSHYSFVSSINGVEKGRQDQKDFAKDVLKLLRSNKLDKNIPDPTEYSWESMTQSYVDYFREILGE